MDIDAEDPKGPADVDQPVVESTAPAPSGGTSDQEPAGFDTPFRLEDVPEEHREFVERRNRELQGAFTRKTQELAEQRREVQELAELKASLDSEDTRDEALGKLLEQYGLEFETEDAGQEAAGDVSDPVSELQARLDAMEREKLEERQAAEAEAHVQAQVAHAAAALDALDERLGTVPDASKDAILAISASLPRLEDGLPDMQSAIELWEADRASAIESYLASKRGSAPDVAGGTSGTPQIDLRDRKARLAHAEAVAERSMAKHA